MKIVAAYICDKGKVRIKNQDNLYFHGRILKLLHKKTYFGFLKKTSIKRAVCFGIFDGMGGEQYGEIASYLAAESLKYKMMENKAGRIPGDILLDMCHKANEIIFKKTSELAVNRMGTTAAIIYLQYDRVWICNVGDSRVYRLRRGVFSQLSFDHVSKEETGRKLGLTQHLGMNPEEITFFPYIMDDTVERGDKYLICSDGLTDMVTEEEIKIIMEKDLSPLRCSRLLQKEALNNGGKDNITIISCMIV